MQLHYYALFIPWTTKNDKLLFTSFFPVYYFTCCFSFRGDHSEFHLNVCLSIWIIKILQLNAFMFVIYIQNRLKIKTCICTLAILFDFHFAYCLSGIYLNLVLVFNLNAFHLYFFFFFLFIFSLFLNLLNLRTGRLLKYRFYVNYPAHTYSANYAWEEEGGVVECGQLGFFFILG